MGFRASLDGDTQLKFNALCHALSILAQIPEKEREMIPKVERVIEDRQTQVFGLMFQADNRFVFRLRYHTPTLLKESTERLVAALAPRDQSELNPLIQSYPTKALSGVKNRGRIEFDPILRGRFRGQNAAFIDWGTDSGAPDT